MSRRFMKKDQRCYLWIGYAPEGVSLRAANLAFNDFIADPQRGLALFHDHFTDQAGGVALVWVETGEELLALQAPGPLTGWEVQLHPLVFATNPIRFLYQTDWTLTVYRGRRLGTLMDEYQAGALVRDLDRRSLSGGA
ncbi:MAG TPA: hypothetical protein VJG32_10820 [Anaerolineae bacterium]|nr:hypothetical protein [Anaerolineae bacterium]